MPELFPYQQIGANWLSIMNDALLADEMRLGKCAQTVTACDLINAETVLITCPATVRETWRREFLKWSTKERRINVMFEGAANPVKGAVNICSYDYCKSDERRSDGSAIANPKLMGIEFDLGVFDEMHLLKTIKTARTQAVFGWNKDLGVIHNCGRRWALSGTPAPNNPSELYPIVRTLFSKSFQTPKGKAMNFTEFTERFCKFEDKGFGRKIIGGRNLAELKTRLQPFTLRRKQEEVWPERMAPVRDNLYLDAKSSLAKLCDTETWDLMLELSERLARAKDDDVRRAILERIDDTMKLRLRRILGLAKIKPLADWLRERLEGNDEKIVVFGHHREVLHGLRVALSGVSQIAYIDGSTKPTDRDPQAQTFQNDKNCRVFIGQLLAAGSGIDLSAADEMVLGEYSWVPGDNAQVEQRIQHPLKRRPTLIRYGVVAGTLDERISSVVGAKASVIGQIFG